MKLDEVKVIVFDLDDTICKTKWIFTKQLRESAEYFAKTIGKKDANGWFSELEIINNKLFEIFKVNPKRWVEVVNQTALNADQNIKDEAVNIFNKIYFEPLPFIDGVEESLIKLKERNVSMAIHTHANVEWTWRKYEWLGLERFLPKDKIFITSEDDHKTADSWLRVFEQLGCPPEEGMVVGDSPRSDINPAIEIGVKECVLYQGGEIWSVHQQAVPERVEIIKNMRDIFKSGL